MTKGEIASLLHHYRSNPINAIETLFSVSLDDQQKSLIYHATQQDARVVVKSAQGCGKTATLVWLSIYYLLTREDVRVLITAPSSNQLQRVFRSELQKWLSKMPKVFRDFIQTKKESFYLTDVEYQMANLITGSPTNKEALQGGHSKTYIVMADEASGLEEEIFDTLIGTLGSSDQTAFILTSNPVRNSGRFYEIFQREELSQLWTKLTFTALESALSKDSWIEGMKVQYGEDSDNYKIRVLGEFGSFGESQFFTSPSIEDARNNTLEYRDYQNFAIVGGLDVARFGSDKTVFVTRQGPKLLDITEFSGLDTMEVSHRALEYIRAHQISLLYIDGIGVGAGVVDRLKQLGAPVKDVVVSMASTEPRLYGNLRTQLYGKTKEWLQNGADIPNDPDLMTQLTSCSYTYNNKMQLQILGKKEQKKILGVSPDILDSVTLTFSDGVYSFTPKRKARRIIRKNIRI